MSELTSYMDYLRDLSKKEPRTCLARYYPDVTIHWMGDVGPPPVNKCFNDHSNDCTAKCIWHPDNPDKEERIRLAGKAAAEKNIFQYTDFSKYWEEQQRKWDEWKEKTFAI